MKKIVCFLLTLILVLSAASVTVFATEYTSFNIVFEEKNGEKVNETAIKIFASVDEGALADRTGEFTTEDVKWFKYLPEPETGKTADDYDYVDEELKVYGMLCTDDDVFEHDNYSYFLYISRLYAKEEDSFTRNVKINGVDVDEMNGICWNTGNEFLIKTITNGGSGASAESDITDDTGDPSGEPDIKTDDGETEKAKCKVCGICPIQPLGICLFIWIAIILIVFILVIILISKGKKKNKERK